MYKILCVGKIKEKFLSEGILEYKKRIDGYSKIDIIEVKEYNTPDVSKNIENEGNELLTKISNYF